MKSEDFKNVHKGQQKKEEKPEVKANDPKTVAPEDVAVKDAESEPEADAAVIDPVQVLTDKIRESELRFAAEKENMHKRHRQQVEQAHKYAIQAFAKDLLDIIDALQMAKDSVSDKENPEVAKGITMAFEVMLKTLNKHGIEPIATDGDFDPEMHIAVKMEESKQPKNTILKTLQQGYKMHDRVLRPASVIVAS